MSSLRTRVAWLALALATTGCELVAGIGDRKVATATPDAGRGGQGGVLVTGNGGAVGSGGVSGQGGAGGASGGGAGGSTLGTGGTTVDAAAGAGGAGGAGGVIGQGGMTGSDAGTATGGSAGTGGSTGQGGAKTDGGRDASLGSDANFDTPACSTVAPAGTGSGLLGEYFASPSFGTPVLSRLDGPISFDWPEAPDRGLPSDGFSVRWTGQIAPRYSARYTFFTNTDDGVRLWINGSLILADWNDHSTTENSGTIDLVGGQRYDIKLEYYEAAGLAAAQLSWASTCHPREVVPASQLYPPTASCAAPVAADGTGIVGQYFDNQDFTAARLTRTDPTLSFTWPAGSSPAASLAAGTYSVRWTGQLKARYSGFTTLYVVSDEGARLFVDDALLIDAFTPHTRSENLITIPTTAGQSYNLRLDYFEISGGGQAQLLWGGACQAKEIVPQAQLYPTYGGMVCSGSVTGNGTGLRGDYYDNQDLTNLVATHAGERVDFDWGLAAPDPSVGADTFSVRWSGKVLGRETGGTTFHTWSDDGVRLWIDGRLIIDNWADHQAAKNSGLAYLVAGQLHDIKLEFRENLENAIIKLSWSSPCQAEELVPTSYLFPPGYVVPPDAGPDTAPDTAPDAPPDAAADAPESEAGEPLDAGIDL